MNSGRFTSPVRTGRTHRRLGPRRCFTTTVSFRDGQRNTHRKWMHTMKILRFIAAWFAAKWAKIKRIPGLLKGSYKIIRKAPMHVQIVLLLFVIYLVSPLDVIPNFIPVIGVLDDILVLALMGRYVYRHVPELAEYWGMPAPKPTRKQRIAELELTLSVLREQLAEQDMEIALLRFENDAIAEGFDDLFQRVNVEDLEQQNDF